MQPRSILDIRVLGSFLLCLAAHPAAAQTLIATDDEFAVPYDVDLVVEAFGVLENDTLDDENAGENGATAELLVDVSHGTLALASDGSFTYSPGPTFDGSDSFVYRAVSLPAVSGAATVSLSACSPGPQVFTCWNETAFRAKATELGLFSIEEGFEDVTTWGGIRSPNTALSVTSQRVVWRTNDFDATHTDPPAPPPPAPNQITTGSGAARSGGWGIWDAMHGYAWGSAATCDIDNPPAHCLHHDGVTINPAPGEAPLYGAGGYFTGIHGANISLVIDGDIANPVGGGTIPVGPHLFFGVLDTAGFAELQFRELDGKNGQALYVWADDFTILLGSPPIPAPAMSLSGLFGLGLALVFAAQQSLIRKRD